MAIRYNHYQYLKSPKMILGSVAEEKFAIAASILTNREIYRGYIDAGFNGTLEWIGFRFAFAASASSATILTGRWEIRARGETTWTTLTELFVHEISTPPQLITCPLISHDTVAATNTAPLEIRLIVTISSAVGTAWPSSCRA